MGTSIISQRFFSKAACSLYGKEGKKLLKEKLTIEKGGHFHLCMEGSWQVCEKLPQGQGGELCLSAKLRNLGSQTSLALVEATMVCISPCKEMLQFPGSWG